MIAKLVVWGPDRQQALAKMAAALEQYQIVGPPNNIPFLLRSVNHPEFLKGKVETGFIAANLKDLIPVDGGIESATVPASVAVLYLLLLQQHQSKQQQLQRPVPGSPFDVPSGKR